MNKIMHRLAVFLACSPLIIPLIIGSSDYKLNHEKSIMYGRGNENFGPYAYIDNKYRIYPQYKLKPEYYIYLVDVIVSNYENESIENCPENNFLKNKIITLKYTRYFMAIIPVQFYKIECKT
jgi:hypothetical protein